MHCPILFALIGKRLRITLRAFFGYWDWVDFKKKWLEPEYHPFFKILHKNFKKFESCELLPLNYIVLIDLCRMKTKQTIIWQRKM